MFNKRKEKSPSETFRECVDAAWRAASHAGVSRAIIVSTLEAILNAERRAEAVTTPHIAYLIPKFDGFGRPIKQ
jgi:hypothetical protein